MSGESGEDGSNDWAWAHILWQKKGLRMEEFACMERNVQLAYIASEKLAMKYPLNAEERLAKAYLRKR